MEYIYCKNSEEFDYTMRTLKRMGYKNKHIACNLAFICEMENTEDGTRSI